MTNYAYVRAGNKWAKVDLDDLALVIGSSWYLAPKNYARTNVRGGVNRQVAEDMHTRIMGRREGFMVDHINHDTLDNTRANLRHATQQQNQYNQKLPKNNTSGYKGVFKEGNKWKALTYKNRVPYYLGLYSTREDAALAYNKAALELFGEFANLNVIPGDSE